MQKQRKKRQRKPRTDAQKALKKIRELSPSHVLEVELFVTPEQSVMLQRIQEHLRIIRNTVLGELKKRYDQMVRTKTYKQILREYRQISEKLEKTTDEKHMALLAAERKKCRIRLDALREAYHVTFNDARQYGEMLHETKFTLPDAVTVWSACEMAWHAMEGLLFRNAERVYFYQRDDLVTLQGKQAERSVIVTYEEKCHAWMAQHAGMLFPLIVKPNDVFIEETLSNIQHYRDHAHEIDHRNRALYQAKRPLISTYRIRNNRIVTRVIRGRARYYVQIVLEGLPVVKRKKDGTFRHVYGKGRMGADLGTQSIGIVTKDRVLLKNLAERSPSSREGVSIG